MTQKESILASNAPTHKIAGTEYKGKNPVYSNGRKVSPGIPFVKVS